MSTRTPRKHFEADMKRAESLVALAKSMKNAKRKKRTYRDIRLSAVAMAVGAMDAFLCDAYVDCLTSVLRAYTSQKWKRSLPVDYAKRELPAGELLDTSRIERPLWSIRMAARKVMERDNMLALSRIPENFNGILPASHKIWQHFIDGMIAHNYKRLTGIKKSQIAGLTGQPLAKARKHASSHLLKRLGDTIQKRHDWIHNCGRPMEVIKDLTQGQSEIRIKEIRLFITTLDDYIQSHRLA